MIVCDMLSESESVGLGLGQVQKWGWIKPDKTRSQPTLDNWIYNGNTYLNQREKKINKQLHGFTFTKHITYYHKKINDNMNI
jgi:hypothetical protein